MIDYSNIQNPIVNEDIFTKLIKKETWYKFVFLNAIYLKNSTAAVHWSYYIYFYSKAHNICYINDINFYGSNERQSVTNNIEQLTTKILPHIKTVQNKYYVNSTKDTYKYSIPKFIYFHNHWYWSSAIVKQNINLKPQYNRFKELVSFQYPNWSAWNEIVYPCIIEDIDAMSSGNENMETSEKHKTDKV